MINNLLFADDGILFCKANIEENKNIKSLRERYEKVSGQYINKKKTSQTFSKNVSAETQSQILELWGLTEAHEYSRYLGLPPVVGRARTQAFSRIKSRV